MSKGRKCSNDKLIENYSLLTDAVLNKLQIHRPVFNRQQRLASLVSAATDARRHIVNRIRYYLHNFRGCFELDIHGEVYALIDCVHILIIIRSAQSGEDLIIVHFGR